VADVAGSAGGAAPGDGRTAAQRAALGTGPVRAVAQGPRPNGERQPPRPKAGRRRLALNRAVPRGSGRCRRRVDGLPIPVRFTRLRQGHSALSWKGGYASESTSD